MTYNIKLARYGEAPAKHGDGRMADFLDKLYESGIAETEWEVKFMDRVLLFDRGYNNGDKVVINRLIEKYAHRIGWR